MRTKRSVMLTGSALLTALALGPITASPALATPGSAGTTEAGMRASTEIATTAIDKPEKKKEKEKKKRQEEKKEQKEREKQEQKKEQQEQRKQDEEQRGYESGFADGRADCKNNKPSGLQYTGSGAFQDGFARGYLSGFHSCK